MIRRAFLGICVLPFLMPVAVQACTCSQTPPGKCPGLQKDDVVFLGTVTEIERVAPANPPAPVNPSSGDAGSAAAAAAATVNSSAAPGTPSASSASPVIRYHFRIDEKFAGPDASEIDIFSGGDDGDCGYHFQKDIPYIVFTQPETEGRLFATVCSGTRPASEGIALLPQLRAMSKGQRVASVFGVLRRADPPFLAPSGDPDEPLPSVALQLRSKDDRFRTNTNAVGVYSFYDVHAGTYSFTANLPARMELTQKTLPGGLPPFKIPNGACYEYNVDALPTGHIQGTVYGPDGKPLKIASLELYRAGSYDDDRPWLWGFQGAKGVFDFDHVGPGQYILVYNRLNRMDPNSPFRRAFFPGVTDPSQAQPITLKDGQDLLNLKMKLKEGYPTHQFRVHLKWHDGRPPGTVTVEVKADEGNNPAAQKIADGLWQFTLLDSGNYTVSAYEELLPRRAVPRRRKSGSKNAGVSADCTVPPRIDAAPVHVSGSDTTATDILLIFSGPECSPQ